MFRFLFYIIVIFLYSCNQDHKDKGEEKQSKTKQEVIDDLDTDYKLTAKFNSFDTIVEVFFENTKDSISDIQRKNYNDFISKQDSLLPEILNKIFDFYKSNYGEFKKHYIKSNPFSDKELAKYLPSPSTTTPEKLKFYIIPSTIHIQNKQDCKNGTIEIAFNCIWNTEGFDVLIENWKVVKVAIPEIKYVSGDDL